MFDWLRRAEPATHSPNSQIPSVTALDVPFGLKLAVLFKHSTKCSISRRAYREVLHFRREFPRVPVFLNLVCEERPLAMEISERTGIRHASPQLLVLRKGLVRSVVSHGQITVDEISYLVALEASMRAND